MKKKIITIKTTTIKEPIENKEIIDMTDMDSYNYAKDMEGYNCTIENNGEYVKRRYERVIKEDVKSFRINIDKDVDIYLNEGNLNEPPTHINLRKLYTIAFVIVMLVAAAYIVYEVYGR